MSLILRDRVETLLTESRAGRFLALRSPLVLTIPSRVKIRREDFRSGIATAMSDSTFVDSFDPIFPLVALLLSNGRDLAVVSWP
jgi:hypothetical protein